MNCPNCDDEVLQPRLTKQAIEVDCCPNCDGVWIDRGGCLFFTRHPGRFSEKLALAVEQGRIGVKLSPRNKSRMMQVYYDGQYELDYCQSSNGIWFDSAKLSAISRHDVGFALNLIEDRRDSDEDKESVPENRLRRLSPHFVSLAGSVTGYLGLLWLSLFFLSQMFGTTLTTAIWVASVILGSSLLLSPLLFDSIMKKVFKVSWRTPDQLNNKVNIFIDKVAQQHSIRYPQVGVIDTAVPQAFCYGYTHNHARLIVTSGLLQQLKANELTSVMGFLLGEVVNRDMAIISQTQLLPFICRLLVNKLSVQQHYAFTLLIFLINKVEVALNFMQLPLLRHRVIHADRFSIRYNNPNIYMRSLIELNRACALVKSNQNKKSQDMGSQDLYISAVSCMGMLSCEQAIDIAAQSYRSQVLREDKNKQENINPDETLIEIRADSSKTMTNEDDEIATSLENTLLWQRSNPWSSWFEFFSCWPNLHTRFTYLADFARVNGLTPFVYKVLPSENKIGKNWDAFVLEFIIYISPYLAISIAPVYALAMFAGAQQFSITRIIGVMSLMLGSILLLRLLAYYPFLKFPQVAISMLYRNLNVSAIHPVACEVNGMLMGRQIPGYLYSNNTYIKDSTGILSVTHAGKVELPSQISEALKDDRSVGARVVVQGWYRHSLRPFMEIKSIKIADKLYINHIPAVKRSLSALLCLVGLVLVII